MKKYISIVALSIGILILAGCFHAPSPQPSPPVTAPQKTDVEKQPDVSPTPTPSIISPPSPQSFEDGKLYLDAIAAKDPAICGKIKDASLKTRCETEVKKTSAQK